MGHAWGCYGHRVDDATSAAVGSLRRIAFLLERALESTYRVKSFRGAAATLNGLPDGELEHRADVGTLQELPGVGSTTATVITEAVRGGVPAYLAELEERSGGPVATGGEELLGTLRGDVHTHSDWSDGGSPIAEMATTARDLGHEYVALTDHSPRLTVAHGLTAERLREQLGIVAGLAEELAPFRLLTGIECDINLDGTLDQTDELLGELDVVVASIHSELKMPREDMTRRMVSAIANPHTDVLGHCTGRNVTPRGRRGKLRGESDFDAEVVFEACRQFDVAVEINCRPERLDPPRRLLKLAVETGCLFAIDTDAHAPGQLDWRAYGAARAMECGVPVERIVTSWPVDDLVAWTGSKA
jgi:putative hydrolase